VTHVNDEELGAVVTALSLPETHRRSVIDAAYPIGSTPEKVRRALLKAVTAGEPGALILERIARDALESTTASVLDITFDLGLVAHHRQTTPEILARCISGLRAKLEQQSANTETRRDGASRNRRMWLRNTLNDAKRNPKADIETLMNGLRFDEQYPLHHKHLPNRILDETFDDLSDFFKKPQDVLSLPTGSKPGSAISRALNHSSRESGLTSREAVIEAQVLSPALQNPHTTEETIRTFVTDIDMTLRWFREPQFVAAALSNNPNTPAVWLDSLARTFPEEFASGINVQQVKWRDWHPFFTDNEFMRGWDDLATNTATPPKTLGLLCDAVSGAAASGAGCLPHDDPPTWERLKNTVANLARHHASPPDVLRKLSSIGIPEPLPELLRNPNTPTCVLSNICETAALAIRSGSPSQIVDELYPLLYHPNTSLSSAEEVANAFTRLHPCDPHAAGLRRALNRRSLARLNNNHIGHTDAKCCG